MSFAVPAFVPLNFFNLCESPQSGASSIHDARTLTHGGSTAQILLNGQVYTLRIARAEKLILTK